jgi:hypothetical protein
VTIEANLGIPFVAESTAQILFFFLTVCLPFSLVVIAMVPVGQMTAEYMEGLPALSSYTVNVLGSLVGVLASFAIAAFSTPPWLASGVALLILVLHLRSGALYRWASVLAIVLTCSAMYGFDHRPRQVTIWSPYNKIEAGMAPYYFAPDGHEVASTVMLRVQNSYYQRILNLSDATARRWGSHPLFQAWRYRYDYPYFWKPHPREVLILGAGTGNDVVAALRNGAEHVDAVEIDPELLRLGKELHPEQRYADPRVRVIADDARAVLRKPGKRYDLIVFGLLDAHTSFYS